MMGSISSFLVLIISIRLVSGSGARLSPSAGKIKNMLGGLHDSYHPAVATALEWIGEVSFQGQTVMMPYHWKMPTVKQLLSRVEPPLTCQEQQFYSLMQEVMKEKVRTVTEWIEMTHQERRSFDLLDTLCRDNHDYCPTEAERTKNQKNLLPGRREKRLAFLGLVGSLFSMGSSVYRIVQGHLLQQKVSRLAGEVRDLETGVHAAHEGLNTLRGAHNNLVLYMASAFREMDDKILHARCELHIRESINSMTTFWLQLYSTSYLPLLDSRGGKKVTETLLPMQTLNDILQQAGRPSSESVILDYPLMYDESEFVTFHHNKNELIISGLLTIPIVEKRSIFPVFRVLTHEMGKEGGVVFDAPQYVALQYDQELYVHPIDHESCPLKLSERLICRQSSESLTDGSCLQTLLQGYPIRESCFKKDKRASVVTGHRNLLVRSDEEMEVVKTQWGGKTTVRSHKPCPKACFMSYGEFDLLIVKGETFHGTAISLEGTLYDLENELNFSVQVDMSGHEETMMIDEALLLITAEPWSFVPSFHKDEHFRTIFVTLTVSFMLVVCLWTLWNHRQRLVAVICYLRRTPCARRPLEHRVIYQQEDEVPRARVERMREERTRAGQPRQLAIMPRVEVA